jgi:hypothetical protein
MKDQGGSAAHDSPAPAAVQPDVTSEPLELSDPCDEVLGA